MGRILLEPGAREQLRQQALKLYPALAQSCCIEAPEVAAGFCLQLGDPARLTADPQAYPPAGNAAGAVIQGSAKSSRPGKRVKASLPDFYIDLLNGKLRWRIEHPGSEALARACLQNLPKGSLVWDATAGLGRDALILAARGAQVMMFERCAPVYLLLYDALLRSQAAKIYDFALPRLCFGSALDYARQAGLWGACDTFLANSAVKPEVQSPIVSSEKPAQKVSIICNNTDKAWKNSLEDDSSAFPAATETGSISAAGTSVQNEKEDLRDLIADVFSSEQPTQPEIIYYDPMFPSRKKSAQVKKEMQIFHLLVGFDEDTLTTAEGLLDCCKRRLVIKRPQGAPPLASTKLRLAYSVDGGSCRFDCYLSFAS